MKNIKSSKSFKKLFENQNIINNSYLVVIKDDFDKEQVIKELESIGCEIIIA